MAQATDPGYFRERERARRNLESIRPRVSEETFRLLLSLLAESPDPDQALNLFERMLPETVPSGGPLASLFREHPRLLHYAVSILGHSYWLGETLIQNQDVFQLLLAEKRLERALGHDDYRERLEGFRAKVPAREISALLARFRKREYIRIALRDVLGVATLAETTAEISALADVLIQAALAEIEGRMRERFEIALPSESGQSFPPAFSVLAMGKLGGEELNYSSDVDIVYLYDDAEDLETSAVHEFFVRQAQSLTDLLSRPTPEGAVFRIDLRLRPQGQEGELAVGVRGALRYYAREAGDWELQALIKARRCAGDSGLARRFIHGVEDRIYTPDINFQAIETALDSRQRIEERRQRMPLARQNAAPKSGRGDAAQLRLQPASPPAGAGEGIDVKLDRGGIRDIEFLVQCLQRVYGGEERWLRPGGTLFSLQKLNDKGHLSGKEFHELTQAYEFLRRVEHALQLQRGQQLHRLPSAGEAFEVLQRSVLRGASGGLLDRLRGHMASVTAIYERVIRSQKRIEQEGRDMFQLTAAPAGAVRELPFEQLMQRIALDAPGLHAVIARAGCGLHGRRNLHRFLSSALTSPERYAALVENPGAVEKAMELFENSDYLADLLVRHPDALRRLGHLAQEETPRLFDFDSDGLFPAAMAESDPAEALAMLRREFRGHLLANGARSLLYAPQVYEALRGSSRLAQEAIRCALRITGGEQALAVFALGRLGTWEFDAGSDADLLFCRASGTDPERARMMAEKLVHALAAYTREGTIFAVDARLRPRGGEGELVITPAEMERYLAEEAQPWEALTYTKLRFAAGREDLAAQVLPVVQARTTRMAAQPGFAAAAVEMRARLEKSNRYEQSFKLASGGFYDIDFLASYLMLKSGGAAPENTDDRLRHLVRAGALPPTTAEMLREAARLYRTVDHAIRLVTGRPRPALPASEHSRAAVETLVNRMLKRRPGGDLQQDLDSTAERVREAFVDNLTI